MGTFDKKIERKKLKKWIGLEDVKSKAKDAFSKNDIKEFVSFIFQYVNIAYDLDDDTMLSELPWWEVGMAYDVSNVINRPMLKVPMMMETGKKSKKEDILERNYSWEYPERTWYAILHQFSKNYGWVSEYVENMDVDDAIALLQEISIDDQLEREFYYSLSEIAYPYDQNRKAGIFKPLERPEWMREKVTVLAPRKTKIRKDFMPVGLIIGSKQNDIEH